jgi:toxin ParE1/3/4
MVIRHRVVVSSRVTAKLIEQEDYLAERASPAVASAYIDRLVAYIADLDTFPDRGHPRHDILHGLWIIGYRSSINIALVIERPRVYVVGVY